jgi:hypothetical protein
MGFPSGSYDPVYEPFYAGFEETFLNIHETILFSFSLLFCLLQCKELLIIKNALNKT